MAIPPRLPNHLDENAWAKLKHKKDEGLKDDLKYLNTLLKDYAYAKNSGREETLISNIDRTCEEIIDEARRVLRQPDLKEDVEFFCEKAVVYGQSLIKMCLDEKKNVLANASDSEKAVATFLEARAALHRNLTQGCTRLNAIAKAAAAKAKEAQTLAAKFVTDFEAKGHFPKIQACVTATTEMAQEADTIYAPIFAAFDEQRQEGGFKKLHGIGPEEAKKVKLADALWGKMNALLKEAELAVKNTHTADEIAKSCEESFRLKTASSKQGMEEAMVVANRMIAASKKAIEEKLRSIKDALVMNTKFVNAAKGNYAEEVMRKLESYKTSPDPVKDCGDLLGWLEAIQPKFKDTIKRVLIELKTVREMHDNVIQRIEKDQHYTYLSELAAQWKHNDLDASITEYNDLVKTGAPKEKAEIEKGIVTVKKALQIFEKQAKSKKK